MSPFKWERSKQKPQLAQSSQASLAPPNAMYSMSGESLKLHEKYRPQSLAEIVGNKETIEALKAFVEEKNFNDLLLYGEVGVGKTSAARCIASELQAVSFERNVAELAGTDKESRVLLKSLKKFAKTIPLTRSSIPFKIAILDEIEGMSPKVQDQLLKIMKYYHKNVRFILICNNINDKAIVEKIKSRCDRLEFKKVSPEDILIRLKHIADQENVKISDEEMVAIAGEADGRVRDAIIKLQRVASVLKMKKDKSPSEETEEELLSVDRLIESIVSPKKGDTT